VLLMSMHQRHRRFLSKCLEAIMTLPVLTQLVLLYDDLIRDFIHRISNEITYH
jgi:hypothetical protein